MKPTNLWSPVTPQAALKYESSWCQLCHYDNLQCWHNHDFFSVDASKMLIRLSLCCATSDVMLCYQWHYAVPPVMLSCATSDVMLCHQWRYAVPPVTLCRATSDVMLCHQWRYAVPPVTLCCATSDDTWLSCHHDDFLFSADVTQMLISSIRFHSIHTYSLTTYWCHHFNREQDPDNHNDPNGSQ